ncbi:hypothetical protein [Cytobacillus dafuensis]|uniref:Yip1 domain-containing protein n=1 Tax=Cytobacillus dafuensis TaxID=1742359 RepID=A0A5B8Z949_CYTDA|nr:hypothetical protein [Cytobacillus dafuensis]QED49645.1 hypothetical protein FSZ17_21555 [Cytobacillus dafuensis]
MIYYVHLWKGLLDPNVFSYQIGKAEEVRGVWKKAALLTLFSILLFSLSGYFGLGQDFLMKEITEISRQELEAKKLLITAGQLLWGLAYALFILFGFSVILWAMLDLPYKKIVVVQLFVLSLLLAEKAILLPLNIWLGIGPEASPFSLGVLMRYMTSNIIIVQFFSHLSIFKIWVIYFQYKGLKNVSEKSPRLVLFIIIFVHVFFWLASALLSYLKIESLI